MDGSDLQHRGLLADVSRAYFVDGLSKVEVADRFGVSRFQAARLLEEARSSGVVTIEVHDPRLPRSGRERDLADLLGVADVRIVDEHRDGLSTRERVGTAVLARVAAAVRPGDTVGLSWSRTLDAAARFVPAMPPCTVVQLTGASEMGDGRTFAQLLTQLDQRGVSTMPLYAPVVVDEPATAQDLRRQPIVADALSRAGALDVAVLAIGAWQENGSSIWNRVPEETRELVLASGVVAETAGIFFNAAGEEVRTVLDGRVIGVGLQQLRVARLAVGFSAGADRADAVFAVARAGLFSALIVDDALAAALIGEMTVEAS